MKKVIDGKLYNTDTATCLGEWSNDFNTGEFKFEREALYRTKSRAYFLCGKGGSLSRYAVSVGNGAWCGGEKIIPLTREAAREWAETKLETDEYIAIFGAADEPGGTREKLNISLSPGAIRRLEVLSEETGKSISQIIEECFTKQ